MDRNRAAGRPARRGARRPDDGGVARITMAAPPLADDVARRMRRYLVQMSVRVVCFVGAMVVDHWSRWVLLAGAVVLPYVAVVLANAGQDRPVDPGTLLDPRSLPAAPTPPAPTPPAPTPPGGQP